MPPVQRLVQPGRRVELFWLASRHELASLRALMKWLSILPLLAFAYFLGACEKHSASELPPEHATAFGEHAWPGHDENVASTGATAASAKPETAGATDGKPTTAPKFFPESK